MQTNKPTPKSLRGKTFYEALTLYPDPECDCPDLTKADGIPNVCQVKAHSANYDIIVRLEKSGQWKPKRLPKAERESELATRRGLMKMVLFGKLSPEWKKEANRLAPYLIAYLGVLQCGKLVKGEQARLRKYLGLTKKEFKAAQEEGLTKALLAGPSKYPGPYAKKNMEVK